MQQSVALEFVFLDVIRRVRTRDTEHAFLYIRPDCLSPSCSILHQPPLGEPHLLPLFTDSNLSP